MKQSLKYWLIRSFTEIAKFLKSWLISLLIIIPIFWLVVIPHGWLDEDVVLECEKVHPNSFQGQLICQNRVAGAKAEKQLEIAAKKCVDIDEPRMRNLVSAIKETATKTTNENLSTIAPQLKTKFQSIKFEVQKSALNPNLDVIVASVKTECNSNYKMLINIDAGNEANIVSRFRVWENSPPEMMSTDRYLPEFAWVRKP